MRNFIQHVADYDIKGNRRRWQKIVTAMAAVVVFCTTYALILPAITMDRSLVCEVPQHHHDASCYKTVEGSSEKQLVCGLEEHRHTAACYDAAPAKYKKYYCGEIGHTHSVEKHCYSADGALICTIPVHEHTLACMSNPNADVEKAAKWEKTFADVELTGNWAEDVLDIAETQIGYTESTRNYEVQKDGKTMKGYTRYGDRYGLPYGDWSAMFCAFCIDYAGVKDYPLESECSEWIKALSYDGNQPDKPVYYHAAGTHEPKPGDLVFFDGNKSDSGSEGQPEIDHVGFISDIIDATEDEPAQLVTIEGDSDNKVQTVAYDIDDESIRGYAVIPENENYKVRIPGSDLFNTKIKSEPARDGAVAVIEGALPDNAKVRIESIALSEDILTEYFGRDKAKAMNSCVAYDIMIMAGGKEWQPDESVSVKVKKPAIDVMENDVFSAAHVDSKTDSVSEVETAFINDTGDIVFDADGFSAYIFYTVDFEYEDVTWSIEGEGSIQLSELLEKLGIKRPVEDVVKVKFSEPSLLEVTELDGDWLLKSLEPFDTEENLTIRFADGQEIDIIVTDAQINSNAGYWKKVTSIDDTNAKYIIVRNTGTNANNNYALTQGATNRQTQITVNAVSGQTGYYTISTALPDAAQFTFGTAIGGGGSTTLVTNGGYYLTVGSTGDNIFNTTSANVNVNYSGSNWRIANGSRYLQYYSNNFGRSNSNTTTYADMNIYKYYPGTTNASGVFTVPVYTIRVDASGNAIGNAVYQTSLTVNSNSTTTNINEALFNNYNVEGSYVGAYFGTEYNAATSNVVSITGSGDSNSSRRVHVTTSDGTTTDYNNGSNGLYLMYTEPSESDEKVWQKITSLDDITSGDHYMILYGNYAIGVSDNAKSGANAGMTLLSGTTDKYTTDLDEAYQWTFTGSDNAYVISNDRTPTRYLIINNNIVDTSSRDVIFTYNTSNGGYWTLAGTGGGNGHYLTGNDSGVFNRSTNLSTSSRMAIYKEVTTTEPTVTYETTRDGNNYSVTVYGIPVNAVGLPVTEATQLGIKEFSSGAEVTPEGLLQEYGINGTLREAYYGTVIEETYPDVSSIQRTGSAGNYVLNVNYGTGQSLAVTENNENALFLKYRVKGAVIPEDTREIVHSKYIDAFRDGVDNPDTTLDNTAGSSDLKDLYRLYLDIGPEAAYENMDILFVIDRSSSMCQTYDGSNRGGGDAVDILGYGTSTTENMVWRRAALDSMLNGLSPGQYENTSNGNERYHDNLETLESNGLLSKIWSVNPNNRIAVVEFASLAQTEGWSTEIGPFTEDNTEGGTNYMAGLITARELLENSSNDGRRKVMFFISDGTPSRYMTQNAQGTWVSNGSTLSPSNCVPGNALYDNTVDYINDFMDDFSTKNGNTPNKFEVEIHCISVGSGTSSADATNVPFLAMMDEDGDPSTTATMRSSILSSLNFKEIQAKIDSLVTNKVGLCNDIVLNDTLSEYVEFADQDDFKVEMVSTRNNTSRTLYENGRFVKTADFNAEDYVEAVSYDKTAKTVQIKLKNQLVGEVIFRTSFNVKTTAQAYAEYAENIAKSDDTGYNGVEGDKGTDYTGNTTSSEQPGFYSNSDAVVTYTQKFGEDENTVEVPFDDPVIQVSFEEKVSVKLQKTNASGVPITSPASFEVYSDENLTEKVGGTVTTDGKGEAVINDLVAGSTYWLVETDPPDGYKRMPDARSFNVTDDGAVVPVHDAYLSAANGVLYVKNSNGTTLPATGGHGRYLFYILGATLLGGALIYGCILRRKRERRDEEGTSDAAK